MLSQARCTRVPWASKPTIWYGSRMKVRDVLRLLRQDGWHLVATRGSHRQFKHATKPGKVTVAGREGLEVPTGTLRAIRRQAGLEDLEDQ